MTMESEACRSSLWRCSMAPFGGGKTGGKERGADQRETAEEGGEG